MLVYNPIRMVEGRPLQYYDPQASPTTIASSQFPYFERFEAVYNRPVMSEDIFPQFPNSTQVIFSQKCSIQFLKEIFLCLQSDSDNSSVSSVEVSSRASTKPELSKFPVAATVKTHVQCCWESCGIAFESLDQLATHVTRLHASCGPGGLFYCRWEGCTRNDRGFNAR